METGGPASANMFVITAVNVRVGATAGSFWTSVSDDLRASVVFRDETTK